MDVKDTQRTVSEFLLLEGRAAEKIVICLRNVYSSSLDYCASVFRWTSEVRRGNKGLRNKGPPGRPHRHETDTVIRLILQEYPNTSLRTIVETLAISPEMVRTHMSRIGHILKILCCISHALTYELKQIRLSMCVELLCKLRADTHAN
jgi:hypothetical protein